MSHVDEPISKMTRISDYSTKDVISYLSGALGMNVSTRSLQKWRAELYKVDDIRASFEAITIRENSRALIKHYKLVHLKILLIMGYMTKRFRSIPIGLTQTVSFINGRAMLLLDEYEIDEVIRELRNL